MKSTDITNNCELNAARAEIREVLEKHGTVWEVPQTFLDLTNSRRPDPYLVKSVLGTFPDGFHHILMDEIFALAAGMNKRPVNRSAASRADLMSAVANLIYAFDQVTLSINSRFDETQARLYGEP